MSTKETKQSVKKLSGETYDLFKAFKHMVSAELYLNSIARSGKVEYQAKNYINTFLTRIRANLRDLKMLVPTELVYLIEEDMLAPEVSLQIDNIVDMLSDLPKGIRDEIETYIESRHNVYNLNKD